MSNYFSSYCTLIGSLEQLDHCKQANGLADLLARIKQLWHCSDLGDHELLGEIARLNQIPIQPSTQSSFQSSFQLSNQAAPVNLAGSWLPYRYQAKRHLINWLIPFGHATEPFQDEYISRCRQQLINQIIQPCSSPAFALQQAEMVADVKPTGFIFHLSRCGSTLVSGCLSELESTCVFSESPLLTEVLLDGDLSLVQQKNFLRAFINLQAAAFPNRPHMIIKWNAWDIFCWEIIRELHPQVPVIFLVRDPVEILASHQRSAGRHMAGDKSLATLHPVFSRVSDEQTLLGWQSGVLGALLGEMNRVKHDNAILCLDYKNLDVVGMNKICHHFGIDTHSARFATRLKFHSKAPQIVFFNDDQVKQTIFSTDEKIGIRASLLDLHQQFFEQ